MMRRVVVVGMMLLTMAGCVTRGPVPVAPPPDLTAVAGRTICIDPGHGGRWPGAVAPSNGLRESDINLAVALVLRDLLEGAGADVVMTRTEDVALDSSSLGADLTARSALANSVGADVFISIHHNADPRPRSKRNDLEVYYKLGDDGPSLDVAQCLTWSLAALLRRDAEAKRLLPGNYRVLRTAQVPAVLLESSYLTSRRNARFLTRPDADRAEAVAIAAGLARYFAMQPPTVASIHIEEIEGGRYHQVRWRLAGGTDIDPALIHLSLNGREAPGQMQLLEDGVAWTFDETLPNGAHRIALALANRHGASLRASETLTVDRPPARLLVEQTPAQTPDKGAGEILLTVRGQDAFGFSVADGTEVLLNGDRRARFKGGVARFYLDADMLPPRVVLASGDVSTEFQLRLNGSAYHSLRVADRDSGAPVGGVVLTDTEGRAVGATTPEGWAAVPGEVASVVLSRDGYESTMAALDYSRARVELVPVDLGLLHGRRIAIDPVAGGRDPGAVGPHGMRASDYNLDIARRLAGYLQAAGAAPLLLRDDDSDWTEVQRVARAAQAGAELYLAVTVGMDAGKARLLELSGYFRGMPPDFVAHYPGSTKGIPLAQAVAASLAIENVSPSVAYIIQQTSCPAVMIHPAHVSRPEQEAMLSDAANRRSLAWGIYRGVVSFYEGLE